MIDRDEAIALARILATRRRHDLGRVLQANFVDIPGTSMHEHWFILFENQKRRTGCTPFVVNGHTGKIRGERLPVWIALLLEYCEDRRIHRQTRRDE